MITKIHPPFIVVNVPQRDVRPVSHSRIGLLIKMRQFYASVLRNKIEFIGLISNRHISLCMIPPRQPGQKLSRMVALVCAIGQCALPPSSALVFSLVVG
jgi:hypothetical protein